MVTAAAATCKAMSLQPMRCVQILCIMMTLVTMQTQLVTVATSYCSWAPLQWQLTAMIHPCSHNLWGNVWQLTTMIHPCSHNLQGNVWRLTTMIHPCSQDLWGNVAVNKCVCSWDFNLTTHQVQWQSLQTPINSGINQLCYATVRCCAMVCWQLACHLRQGSNNVVGLYTWYLA